MRSYRVLRERHLRPKKGLGQHFLVDPQAVQKIVDAAEIDEGDTVLEVGPGPGTLTVPLAQRAGQVVAVEIDERMLDPLRELLQSHDNVRIVHGDILEQDVASLVGQGPFKVVANLPYHITSAVLRHLLESCPRPSLLVVTVQREVADRIVGRSDRRSRHKQSQKMSLLAISIQFYGRPRIVARVPAGAFRPMPKVDSAVVRIETHDPLPWDVPDERAFFRVVRAGFAQSRKQLHNALRGGLHLADELLSAALATSGIDGERRAETLSVDEWVALSNALVTELLKKEPSRG
jgi:16S rRNA (adenine1518-N6/adenine1519-N6)-dimethyltransferase